MLPTLLFNVISGLVVDKATDLAQHHVEEMIDNILPQEAKEELDQIIKEDPEHPFETAKDALVAAAAGKLPSLNADGSIMPSEVSFTIKFDPNTLEATVEQS